MDTINREHRSWNMSRIKDKDTKPEIPVRSMLHRMGFRFRLHQKDLSGKPDIVLPKHKTVVFVHGCFWHRHEGCKLAFTPKSRVDFWNAKFNANVERDRRNLQDLKAAGWQVIVIWQCETKDPDKLAKRLGSELA